MDEYNILAIIVLILTIITTILVIRKILKSELSKTPKTLLVTLTILLALPIWYVTQLAIITTTAKIAPQSPIVDCFMLDAEQCQKRSDCKVTVGEGTQPFCTRKD